MDYVKIYQTISDCINFIDCMRWFSLWPMIQKKSKGNSKCWLNHKKKLDKIKGNYPQENPKHLQRRKLAVSNGIPHLSKP